MGFYLSTLFALHYGYATLKLEVKTNKGGTHKMDFMNRGGRPVQQNTQTQTTPTLGNTPDAGKPGPSQKATRIKDKSKATRISYIGFLAAVTILILAVVLSVAFAKSEKDFVKEDKFQAVFLNGGQVYFGKITDLNTSYLSMQNIYYLRVNQQVQPDQQQNAAANDISLVKLGCELHGPEDSMVINREQVIFWENLKDDGQVAKAVAEYVKANPKGQDCSQQQGSGAGNTSTPPAANDAPGTSSPAATPAPSGNAPSSSTPATPAPTTPPATGTNRR